ncbi:unnamed protein product [Cylicostephanus goldi]|uniref:Uncharacterized protein n=1 Tax=Cylicostephanus goldi TaxID=71465 RepID=A0A3P6SCU2_CYLGO|nr:unnamed protein product [Cylicostephanus goldi]
MDAEECGMDDDAVAREKGHICAVRGLDHRMTRFCNGTMPVETRSRRRCTRQQRAIEPRRDSTRTLSPRDTTK